MQPARDRAEAKQEDKSHRQDGSKSRAAKVYAPQLENFEMLAPIEREYFMRISRQEQITSERQPENWRARPALAPAARKPAQKRFAIARASRIGGATAAATYSAVAASSAASSAAAATSSAAAEAECLDDDGYSDEDFCDFFEFDTLYQEQPNYALVLTWSSYLRRRYAAMNGVRTPLQMGRPTPTALGPPPIENWRERPAATTAAIGSWRQHCDHSDERKQSKSNNYYLQLPPPVATVTRVRSEVPERYAAPRSTYQPWECRERQHHGGSRGQRNQWSIAGANYRNQAPEHSGNSMFQGATNGLIGVPAGREVQRANFRGFSMIGGFQRARSFGSSSCSISSNRRPPPNAGGSPGRHVSM